MPRLRVTRNSVTGANAAGAAASVPWTPASITTTIWLDAADAATITLNGSTVSQWNDKSGNACNVTQATASKQPSFSASGLNSKGLITFDGSNDLLQNTLKPAGDSSITQTSIIAVWRTIAKSGDDVYIMLGNDTVAGSVRALFSPNNSTVLKYTNWSSESSGTLGVDVAGSHHIFHLNQEYTTAQQITLYRDGTKDAGHPQLLATQQARLTNGIIIGTSNSAYEGLHYCNISVAEILVTNFALNSTQRQQAEGYLAHKWGLTANLPSDHPYKTAAPTIPVSSYDADASTYFAAVEAADGQSLESGVKTAINDFIVGCKADGTWSALKASCLLAGARTLAGALVPLVGTAPTNFNFVSGDYNRTTGLVGNGYSKYLDSNRLDSTDPQDNSHVSVYKTAGTTGGSLLGSANPPSYNRMTGMDILGSGYRFFSRDAGTALGSSSATGVVGVSRASSTTISIRVASSTSSSSSLSGTPSGNKYFVFDRSGGGSYYSSARLSFYSIGEAVDLALLDTRLTTLMSALATAIP